MQSQQGLGHADWVSYAEEFEFLPKGSRESQEDIKQDRSIAFDLCEDHCGGIRGALELETGDERGGRAQVWRWVTD